MAQGNGACGDLLDGAVCAVLLRPLPLRLLSVAAGSARGRFVDSADVQPRQTGFGIEQKLARGNHLLARREAGEHFRPAIRLAAAAHFRGAIAAALLRSEEHTSELQSL